METKLNDNEVKEIARMQKKIDTYEAFIKAAFMMAHNGKKVNYPRIDTSLSMEMGYLWHFIKDHKDIK